MVGQGTSRVPLLRAWSGWALQLVQNTCRVWQLVVLDCHRTASCDIDSRHIASPKLSATAPAAPRVRRLYLHVSHETLTLSLSGYEFARGDVQFKNESKLISYEVLCCISGGEASCRCQCSLTGACG